MEESIRSVRHSENQVENIGHVLGTTIDHVYSISSAAESARKQSTQSVKLVEVLLQALYSVGNLENDISPLDFLTNLATINDKHSNKINKLSLAVTVI